MKQIHLLTANPIKIAAANLTFKKYGIEVLPLKLDIPEIQADTSQEIASHMAQVAYESTKLPVIREDHSFFIDELRMPGPYMAYMEQQASIEQLLKILNTLSKRAGRFELAAAFVDAQGNLHEFSYQVPVEFADKPKGDPSLKWDRVFRFPGEDRVFAECPQSERTDVWAKNFEQIAKLIAGSE